MFYHCWINIAQWKSNMLLFSAIKTVLSEWAALLAMIEGCMLQEIALPSIDLIYHYLS